MKILVSDRPDSMAPNSAHERAVLQAGLPGANVVHLPYTDDAAFRREIADADALITAYLRVDADLLSVAPRLKVVSINATGWDAVDLEAAARHGVGVCCVGEYCTHEVADHTMALLLALYRGIKHYIRDVETNHEWRFTSLETPHRLSEQTLGIVGLGRIGSDVAKKAKAFGLTVVATDPFIDPAHAAGLGVELVSREELFARADIVSNHMNLTDENRGYFDEAAFAAMARRPMFLNTARGLAVIEPALVAALDADHVRAAGLDVLTEELPDLDGHPLLGRDNVIVTPHAAFLSDGALSDLERIPCENVVHYLTGQHDKLFKRVL